MYSAKHKYYGETAKNYDKERFGNLKGKIYDFFEKWSVKRALDGFSKTYFILDIPCGTGRITKYIHDLGYDVIGADISKDMLKRAQKLNLKCVLRDAEDIKLPNKYYHIVVCVRFMGHLPFVNKIRVLKELKRVAYRIIITFYFKPKPDWYAISPNELKHLLEICGLQIISKHPIFPGWSDGVTYLLNAIN